MYTETAIKQLYTVHIWLNNIWQLRKLGKALFLFSISV